MWRNVAEKGSNGIKILIEGPMKMFCDNQAAISIAKNPIHHDQTKHVEMDQHFIKEKIEEGTVTLIDTLIGLQTAYILTKAFSRIKFEDLKSKLGLINIYNPNWRGVLKFISDSRNITAVISLLISLFYSLILWDIFSPIIKDIFLYLFGKFVFALG